MKKELRDLATQFMEAYLALCKTFRCSIEDYVHPQDVDGQADGVEVYVWGPRDDGEKFIEKDRQVLTARIEGTE